MTWLILRMPTLIIWHNFWSSLVDQVHGNQHISLRTMQDCKLIWNSMFACTMQFHVYQVSEGVHTSQGLTARQQHGQCYADVLHKLNFMTQLLCGNCYIRLTWAYSLPLAWTLSHACPTQAEPCSPPTAQMPSCMYCLGPQPTYYTNNSMRVLLRPTTHLLCK